MARSTTRSGNHFQARTTDLTATQIGGTAVPEGAIAWVDARVIAKSTGDVHGAWKLGVAVRRNGANSAALIGSALDQVTAQKDAGASLWTAVLKLNGSMATVEVVGALATTIDWAVTYESVIMEV